MPLLITLIMVCSLSLSTSSCGKNNELGTTQENANNTNGNTTNPAGSKMKITIGTAVFTATLSNNSTGNAFKTRLPITLNMTELNSNEKYVDFQTALPSNAGDFGNSRQRIPFQTVHP